MGIEAVSEKITNGIQEHIDNVVKDKREYYKNNPNAIPRIVDDVIAHYGNKNAIISGGASLIPGPLGMAAAVPEIILVVKNQIEMIYDIAIAYGKNEEISRELILGILLSASGQGATALFVVRGQKVLMKRAGLRVIQKIVKILGGEITQKALKSLAAKWVPVVGAVAMAAWVKYTTSKIGEQAKNILSKEIVVEQEELVEIVDHEVFFGDGIQNRDLIDRMKICILINLMKIDGKIDDSEVKFIEECINKTELKSSEKIELISKIASNEKIEIDYAMFKKDKEEGLYLLIDLIALSMTDGQIHITEKMFIKEIGKMLDFSEEDVLELMKQN